MTQTRRDFLGSSAALAAGPETIIIDPKPLFEISPYLYMQFMEPLGITDSSVEAAWDYDANDWRKDLVAVTEDLAPGMIRWGGNFCRYYKWREGVGPVAARPPMRNYDWGGMETNRVGTHEFVNFCRRVGAEPLYCVNFLSDGRRRYWKTREGHRGGDAREAADWVSYANDPDDKLRRSHGVAAPYNLKLWQIGNETSYGADGFTQHECIAHTLDFARAMRPRDPSIRLIGWGDWQRAADESLWAGDLVDRAGEHLDYVAIHLMGQRPVRTDTVLRGLRYQAAPEQAFEELLELSNNVEKKVSLLEATLAAHKSKAGIAITEGHLSLSPHNSHPILHEWLSAVYHARSMNIYQRHGARVKISTGADFCGNRWTVNAVMLQVPRGVSYLMPVGSVMRLFQRHNGKQGIAVRSAPAALDIAASRSANTMFLHVLNTSYSRSVEAAFAVEGMLVSGGRVFEIAPESPREYVNQDQPGVFAPREKPLPPGPVLRWRFPATSVSTVELDVAG
jgi:hypothetical protein